MHKNIIVHKGLVNKHRVKLPLKDDVVFEMKFSTMGNVSMSGPKREPILRPM